MKKIFLAIILVLTPPTYGLAKEFNPPIFLLDYAVVDHSLKNDEGYSIQLLELYRKDPQSVIFISDFWHQKAFKDCNEIIQEYSHIYSKQITLNMSKEARDAVMKPGLDAGKNCFYSFYYDNWDEINITIRNKLKAANIYHK